MRKSGIVTSLIVCAAMSSTAFAADWPGFRGPNRDGKSADKGLLKEWPASGPKLLWKADRIGSGFSSPTVAGGNVYVTGDIDGKLMISAFDLNGKPLGNLEHGRSWDSDPGGARSSVTIDGGKLYLTSGQGLIGCRDTKTGRPVWVRDMVKDFGGHVPGWGYSESVLIHKNMALVTPGGRNCMVALDKETGRTIWTSQGFNGEAHYGSIIPVTFEGVDLFVAGTGGGIFAVEAKTGRVHWSNTFCAGNTANCPTPVYANGYVFWSNGYGKGGICLKLKKTGATVTAEEAWRTRELVSHHGGYVILGDYIYGNTEAGWVCLELKTGQRKWFNPAGNIRKGSLCWADDMFYLFSENGGNLALAAATPEGLTVKGKLTVEGRGPSWAHPIVTGGRLFVRYDQNLYCFDVKGQ